MTNQPTPDQAHTDAFLDAITAAADKLQASGRSPMEAQAGLAYVQALLACRNATTLGLGMIEARADAANLLHRAFDSVIATQQPAG